MLVALLDLLEVCSVSAWLPEPACVSMCRSVIRQVNVIVSLRAARHLRTNAQEILLRLKTVNETQIICASTYSWS